MRLLVTRPEEDCAATVDALARLGHAGVPEPLLVVQPVAGQLPDLTRFQALLITSRNGLRILARLTEERKLPVYAVGPGSAAAARAAGFSEVHDADGDAHALAELVAQRLDPAAGPLLHGAGRDVALGLKERLVEEGFDFRRIVLYAAEPVARFSAVALDALEQGTLDGVLFYSPRTAATFADLIRRAGMQQACTSLSAYCLSHAVAAAIAQLPWKAVHTAAAPNQDALLALL